MPEKQLRRKFNQFFGLQLDGSTHEAATRFAAAALCQVDEIKFASSLRFRAMIVAEARTYRGRNFTPLAQTFGVSPTAMAIQLEFLGLVV